MKKLTKPQKQLLWEFKAGAKVRQGNLKMERPDKSFVRYDCRSLRALINYRLIWVDPADTTYWVIA